MANTYTDAWGTVLDTGTNTLPTARLNTEIEFHNANEVDTGSKLTIASLETSHVQHRPVGSPR